MNFIFVFIFGQTEYGRGRGYKYFVSVSVIAFDIFLIYIWSAFDPVGPVYQLSKHRDNVMASAPLSEVLTGPIRVKITPALSLNIDNVTTALYIIITSP